MKLLTVTVPCYNSEEYLENCIESLLFGGERVEIIIIDDGSTDRTASISDDYAQKYPDIIKVIHQDNGGHGEGLNQGIKHATGKYFKYVDSDDTVSGDFPKFLDKLEAYDNQGGVDLFVTNFCYVYSDSAKDRSVKFGNVLTEDRIMKWSDTNPLRFLQFLPLHCCTFRAELLKQIEEELPKHTYYEDCLLLCRALPFVANMGYSDINLYRYAIGRPSQSMNMSNISKHYADQLLVTKKCFTSCHIDSITEPMLKKCMIHNLYMMFLFASIYAKLNQSIEADCALEEMWQYCRTCDEKWADYFRKRISLRILNIKGKPGWKLTCFFYKLSRKIVRFS